MQVIQDKNVLSAQLKKYKEDQQTIGFVPTMGALHEGHLSLVAESLKDNDITVVSIFVNPTQFDNLTDLEKYPRTLEKDIELLASLSADIILFTPTRENIYDGDITSKTYEFNGLEKVMEGAFRSGHFNGVATIVELLLRTVEPNKAYFGEKDFQQLQIIKKLVALKELPVKIIPCPISRELHGLARSSRNERLTKATREKANFIYNSLITAKSKFGTKSVQEIKESVTNLYENNSDFTLEYFEITDEDTLTPIKKIQENTKYRAFIAVYAEEVRLIDNLALN
ncbi:pantoate--beta-alanine ligase [Croceivirga sp. JEA036]|uniref:pantoate--beta-alanine ligase n=1 Tax=Croceivirga sp. JEA036 TaxID=2721162 RepID=UPI001439E844|nr:pantoate--beta-alanine ligase [Croceivirga sp. JEA036]NJB36860.1 pantoate--beta-alanine ligase [Croceivirga sp. JEA036]